MALRQDLLRAKAGALNMSIPELARQTNLSPQTVRQVLTNPEYQVTLRTFVRIADCLGIDYSLALSDTAQLVEGK